MKIEGLNMPRSEKIPQPPKVSFQSGHPELRWLLAPLSKKHQWADFGSLHHGLEQLRAYEKKSRRFNQKA
jgi:hypothetical protein